MDPTGIQSGSFYILKKVVERFSHNRAGLAWYHTTTIRRHFDDEL